MTRGLVAAALAALAAVGAASDGAVGAQGARCTPTPADALGPFYKPGAPVRARVGAGGYVLTGVVRSSATCRPIARARIEFWLVNEQGEYDDAHRATVFAGRRGAYRFESNRPVGYSGRPPHIHIRVSAPRFRTLVTQHYPRGSQTRATFNLVLRPR